MKRRRGSKKGKGKKAKVMATNEVASNAEDVNTGNNSVAEEEIESDGSDSGGEDEAPLSSMGTDQAQKPASANSGGFSDSTVIKAVYGRVKVKIKTSKTLDSQATTSEALTQNEAEKSCQQTGLEKQGVSGLEKSSEKLEDSANSLSEANNVSTSGDLPKKSAGIKIKSKSFGSNINPCNNAEALKGEKTQNKEPHSVPMDSRFNKKELNAALEVIKKVMKMEAAEPFNVPVDPVALGIPDYFDVIDTPMDFGTIRSNLESGVKYMNSEDVYKDVQYIWDNCYKYNNKGDLVLDLMKRVKKNFSKYWTAAGLYSDYSQGVESSQMNDATPDSNGKDPLKGGSLNNKTRKLHGLKKHKEGCLCAICVMMRRRQEREESARVLEEQMEASSDNPDEVKPEETTPADSLGGEYASSNMENSPELDIDSNLQEKVEEAKLGYAGDLYNRQGEKRDSETELPAKKEGQISALMQLGSRSVEEHTKHQKQNMESENGVLNHTDKETFRTGGGTAISEQQKPKEKLDKYQKAKMLENLRHLENPRIFDLCRTLFVDNKRSVWNGPHSLVQQKASTRKSTIRAAVSKLMQ